MTKSAGYETPYHWWGPGPAPPTPLTLRDLVQNGTIDVECAATLWASLAQHRSLTIIGGPSGLGKSTLLHALLPALPEAWRRLYLRGCYETFAFQDDRRFSPANTTLLANEISPHLPIYLWGQAVQRTLAAGEAGHQLLATAHGRSIMEFAASLTGSPLRVPARLLAAIGLVVLLEPASEGVERRVSELWQLSATRSGVSIDQLGPGDLPTGVAAAHVAAARVAMLPMLGQDLVPPGAVAPAIPDEKCGVPSVAPSATHLEQTPAGE